MFYRRKVILSLLQEFRNEIDKISLEKLLFIFTKHQETPVYQFIPYKYGCYSYSAEADLRTMVKKGLLSENKNNFYKTDQKDYREELKQKDFRLLKKIKNTYGEMDTRGLMKHTYLNFPFYAINSKVAQNLLSKQQYKKVIKAKPHSTQTILFTIGYQGISIEEYLNRLLCNDINILIDVRRNPQSMKYGFSKKRLTQYCKNLDMKYHHIPEVGIASKKRKKLNTQRDYDELFASYQMNTLSETKKAQNKIFNLLKDYKRVALTCFEADICQCHRKPLAEAIQNFSSFDYEVKHI